MTDLVTPCPGVSQVCPRHPVTPCPTPYRGDTGEHALNSADPAPSWVALHEKLRALNDDGYVTPCLDMPDLFVSDDLDERQAAIAWCSDCPARTECGAYAEAANESHHVWAGQDRSPRSYRRSAAAW